MCCCCRYCKKKKAKKLKKEGGEIESPSTTKNEAISAAAVKTVELQTYKLDDLQNFEDDSYYITDPQANEDDANWSVDTTWFYISSSGIMLGPFKTYELVTLYVDNNIDSLTCITRDTLLRHDKGMASWRRLHEMPALNQFVSRSLVNGNAH